MNTALIVFAKVPIAGHVKTRLTPAIHDEEAAELYQAFLFDALDQYAALGADVRLYIDPDVANIRAFNIPRTIGLFEQTGDGLGERMARAFAETFAAGYDRVAIVGTDHPTLPTAFISYAFTCISSPKSIAIGPAEDGGYYLLAMNDFVPEVFREMSYSHSEVFDETLYRIATAGAEAIVLPEWYDVDTPSQLRRLRAEFVESDTFAPRTARVVERLAQRHNWLAD